MSLRKRKCINFREELVYQEIISQKWNFSRFSKKKGISGHPKNNIIKIYHLAEPLS